VYAFRLIVNEIVKGDSNPKKDGRTNSTRWGLNPKVVTVSKFMEEAPKILEKSQLGDLKSQSFRKIKFVTVSIGLDFRSRIYVKKKNSGNLNCSGHTRISVVLNLLIELFRCK
jgi:hypothetical protein